MEKLKQKKNITVFDEVWFNKFIRKRLESRSLSVVALQIAVRLHDK